MPPNSGHVLMSCLQRHPHPTVRRDTPQSRVAERQGPSLTTLIPLLAMNGSCVVITQLLHPFARVGTIPDSVRERCAQETLWDWLEAQTECFDRTTSPPNSVGSRLRADSLDVVTMYPSEAKLI